MRITNKNDNINEFHLYNFILKYHDFNTEDWILCSKSSNIFYYCDYCNIYFCEICKQKLDNFKKINKKFIREMK